MASLPKEHPRSIDPDAFMMLSRLFAEIFPAYLECSEAVQEVIRDMAQIFNSADATEDERQMACQTITEALFPFRHRGQLGIDLTEVEQLARNDARAVQSDMDRQELAFAQRVESLLAQKGMTQTELASRIGVGQSAVSMLLGRSCRPQRRTVERIAGALEVPVEELWPEPADA